MVELTFKKIKYNNKSHLITIIKNYNKDVNYDKVVEAVNKIEEDGFKTNFVFDRETKTFLFGYLFDKYKNLDLQDGSFYTANFKNVLSPNSNYANFVITNTPTIEEKKYTTSGYLSD